jgi:tRNA-Thr(GGU) m(6)t(6)A37 methyltransferase TsaA
LPTDDTDYQIRPVGRVESPLTRRDQAPRQGDEGAPDAWLVLDPGMAEAMRGLAVGTDVLVLTWLHRADRSVLAVHPRGDADRPVTGVFATRSPDRPNPVGLHRVTILAIDGLRLRVRNLEALDATPIVDLKPVLGPAAER